MGGWLSRNWTGTANLGLEIVPFDASHIQGARDAFRRFGKGRHRASLNFGDAVPMLCKLRDVPLLFKGNDFALTDLSAPFRSQASAPSAPDLNPSVSRAVTSSRHMVAAAGFHGDVDSVALATTPNRRW